jgi:RNA polymerase sigma-70 factor (ECF subfamily)
MNRRSFLTHRLSPTAQALRPRPELSRRGGRIGRYEEQAWAEMLSVYGEGFRLRRPHSGGVPVAVSVSVVAMRPSEQVVTLQPLPDEPDTALLARFALRDEAALATLYDRHSRAAYGVAFYILKDAAQAQDIVHDAFLKVWEKPGLFDAARASFPTFFLTVVRHAAISKLRGGRVHLPIDDPEGLPLPFPDERVNLQTGAEERARAEQIRAALHTLKPVQRETVERAFFRGETREDIAAAMSVPVGTVKSRLKYALERLRGVLGEEGEHL